MPVLLPGYVSTSANWYPSDLKYRRFDGLHMVAPFSVLKHFSPIAVTAITEDGDSGEGQLTWALLSAVSAYLYGGLTVQQRVRQAYEDWQKETAEVRASLLGSWARLESGEVERKITRIWRRHGGSLTSVSKIKHQLAALGIKASDAECEAALAEVSGNLKNMVYGEFRLFMWNLLANVAVKADAIQKHH